MSLEDAPFSAKGIAPFLEAKNRERAAACRRATSLIYNLGSNEKIFNASSYLVGPLLALLPHEPEAAGPLATFAEHLTLAAAYPEALMCIDAVIDLKRKQPLGEIDAPWEDAGMKWPWQQALLSLWRGECRLAAGDREGGEAALAHGARTAEASGMPTVFGLLGAGSDFQGTVADRRLFALVQGARALRLRYEGKDACENRKVPKRKASDKPDRGLLELARTYLDDALAVIGPRAKKQFAGLKPRKKSQGPDFESEHRAHSWQRFAYFESALVKELVGDLAGAKQDLGRAKWISALFNPGHKDETDLLEAVERLGVKDLPL